jgi:hypothetical protein
MAHWFVFGPFLLACKRLGFLHETSTKSRTDPKKTINTCKSPVRLKRHFPGLVRRSLQSSKAAATEDDEGGYAFPCRLSRHLVRRSLGEGGRPGCPRNTGEMPTPPGRACAGAGGLGGKRHFLENVNVANPLPGIGKQPLSRYQIELTVLHPGKIAQLS